MDFQEPTVIASDDAARMRSAFLASQEALRTIEQNLTNQTLLSRVVRSEGLAEDGGRALLGQSIVTDKTSSSAQRSDSVAGCKQDARVRLASQHLRRSKKDWGEQWSAWSNP